MVDIVFDFGCYIVEFGFGDVYCCFGLMLCECEIVIIVVFMVLGNVVLQLKVYIVVGLNVGLMCMEIIEMILQMVLYVGFLVVFNGMFVVKEVFVVYDVEVQGVVVVGGLICCDISN